MSSSDSGWGQRSGQAQPGWYPDPADPHTLRYWDGSGWTGYVQQPPAASPQSWRPLYPASDLRPHTDGLAVASLLCGVFGIVLLSAVFGFVALHRIKHAGTRGRGLAITGLILSALWLLIIGGAIAALALYLPSGSTGSVGGPISNSRTVPATDLRVGDCLAVPSTVPSAPSSFRLVSCASPHNGEVIAVSSYPSASYPGEPQAAGRVEHLCRADLATFAGSPNTRLHVVYLYPTEASWNSGGRTYTCIAVNRAHTVIGSMRGSG